MRKSLYVFSLVCLFTLLCMQSMVFAASETATIKNLRISNNSDKVRIVVDADKEVDYQSFALSSPDRVVIDLNDAALAKNIEKEVDINSKYASKVRVAQFKDNVVRVVVETDVKKSGYDIFGIVGGETPYRVAMDFGNISYAAIGSTTGSSTSSSSNDTSYRVNEDFDIDKNAKSVLKGKRITIDPGHGGMDGGGAYGDYK